VEEGFPMDKEQVKAALKKAIESSNKRNFKQTVDLIITLKDLDQKKPDHQVDFFLPLHYPTGRQFKVCGFVGPEMKDAAKRDLDFAIITDDFPIYEKDKKKIKKLANEYDYFIAQANLMAKVAQIFGRTLGPKNKMPNPKSGCVVPPGANLAALKQRLLTTVRVLAKTAPYFQVAVGKEDMDQDHIADSIMTIYQQMVHHLPGEMNNIKDVSIKLTMGPCVKVTASEAPEAKK